MSCPVSGQDREKKSSPKKKTIKTTKLDLDEEKYNVRKFYLKTYCFDYTDEVRKF